MAYRVPMGSEFERLAAEKYVVLTTFRRSGVAVATPIWLAGSDRELVMWSERKAGKVKRIRNNGRVEVQACDRRGRQTHGAKVTGQARLLDDEATERACAVIARKYGAIGHVTMFFSRLRGGPPRTVGIAVKLDAAAATSATAREAHTGHDWLNSRARRAGKAELIAV